MNVILLFSYLFLIGLFFFLYFEHIMKYIYILKKTKLVDFALRNYFFLCIIRVRRTISTNYSIPKKLFHFFPFSVIFDVKVISKYSTLYVMSLSNTCCYIYYDYYQNNCMLTLSHIVGNCLKTLAICLSSLFLQISNLSF